MGRAARGILFLALAAWTTPAETPKRQLVNSHEIYHEIQIAPGAETSVPRYLLSFAEYQQLMLYHPKFGYYASGRVNFTNDFQTFPNALAPYFGQMVAQQIFRMWEGMRRAGTLGPHEKFTIAEFGAGNGMLAESILDYVERQAHEPAAAGWAEFASQLLYACYDRGAALRAAQRRRNARFGSRFEARDGDATDLNRTIPANSLTGVFLSNEMLDVFGVQKVILSQDRPPEVAFVVPFLSGKLFNQLRTHLPASVEQLIVTGDRAIRNLLSNGERNSDTYLGREAFVAFLESQADSKDYASLVHALQFHEVYVPAQVAPELEAHLRRYARSYAAEMAHNGKGVVTYVNLGEEKFIRGAARALKAGYVITIDYGSNWDGIFATRQPHLRVYGPGTSQSTPSDLLTDLALSQPGAGQPGSAVEAPPLLNEIAQIGGLTHGETRGNPDPYRWPSLNDITTDVNFSYLADAGKLAGLKPLFFGSQKALQSGTSISLNARNAGWQLPDRTTELSGWLKQFATNSAFKMLVQQKAGTDDSYAYPDSQAEPLDVNLSDLTASDRERAQRIERRLRGDGN
jgi:SAM-dependent MidA family methyltransferase